MHGPPATPPSLGMPQGGGGKDPRQLWDYWRIVWEGRRILVVVIGLALLVTAFGTSYLLPELYRATALIELDLTGNSGLGTVVERGQGLSFSEHNRAFKTEFVRMRTRALLVRAIKDHDLLERSPSLAGTSQPVEKLRNMTRVEGRAQTNLAELSVVATDPQEAALLANTIARTYAQAGVDELIAEYERTRARIGSEVTETQETRRARLQVQIAQLDEGLPLARLLELPALQENESLREQSGKMDEAERELRALQQTYGPGHPDVREAAARVRESQRQIDDRLAAVRDRLASELATLGGPLSPDQLQDVADLQATASAEMEGTLLDRQLEFQLVARLAKPKAKLMDPALPPREPFSPRLSLNLALALVVGLGFAGGVLYFRDYLDVSVKSIDDVENAVGLPLLAVVPRAADRSAAVLREAFQTLRTGVVFASRGRKDRVVLVTSSGPQEGKSSVALDLARSLASSGDSVVLLDADLRRPAITRELGMESRPGLSSHLAGAERGDWGDLLLPAGKDPASQRVRVLPSGPVPPNPVDLLGAPRFAELIAEAKARHDWVVIDTPPASSVSDALLVGSLSDLALLVIRHDRTDKEVVRRAANRLQSVGTNVAGAVLNDVDMAKSYNRDYFFGRFWYGHYYGEDAREKA